MSPATSGERVIAMIPARLGSERLRYKNLRLLAGKPVIAYAIEAAKGAGVFDRVVVNSDGAALKEIADRYGVEFLLRDPKLADSQAKSDDVVADFMARVPGDLLAWVNPIAPLQTSAEVRAVVEHFIANGLDSLITVESRQVHCVFEGRPVNFSLDGLFAKTQDLVPVQPFVYSVMMWRYATFLAHYRAHGHALLAGKVGYFPVHRHSTIILKYEEDLRLAEAVLRARASAPPPPEYDPVVARIEGKGGR
ncbi:MAG: hypothetical protein HY521_10170 [Proteobacteria bacterium]|nr:hypothetical protein [Pseudomonadota bacterium]